MNQEPSVGDPVSDAKLTTESAFLKLFAVGVIGWVIGCVVLFGMSWVVSRPVGIPSAVIWMISHGWAGFGFGVLAMVGYGLVRGLSLGRAVCAYVLPAGLLTGVALLCLWIYPDNMMREDLATYLPMVLIFYAIALLWMWIRNGATGTDAFARAIIPATVGGGLILGFVTVPVFASDAFHYRNAFRLAISKAEMRNGKFVAEGTLEILESGHYEFIAPRYIWSPDVESTQIESGEITWGGPGTPKGGTTGVYPMQIVWSKALQTGENPEAEFYENSINIEVHNPEEGHRMIYSLSASIPPP